MQSLHRILALAALWFSCQGITVMAATVWSGPDVVFTKLGSEPITVQDVLSPSVSLTRGNAGFLFNPSGGDAGPGPGTPSGTRWAFDTAIGNPGGEAFSAANHAALTFLPFLDAVGGPANPGPAPGVPNVVLNAAGVLHLLAEDIFLDIQFLQWRSALEIGGATFEYRRASAIPLPGALYLMGSALGYLAFRRRPPLLTDGGDDR